MFKKLFGRADLKPFEAFNSPPLVFKLVPATVGALLLLILLTHAAIFLIVV